VDPSAIATRRTRLSLALTVGGALVLMAGVSMVLIGEVIRLERPAGLPQLVMAGVVLAAAGLALGLVCAVVVLSGRQSPVRGEASRQPGETAGYEAPDPAAEWLGPLRDAAVRPVSAAVRETAAARAGMPAAGYGDAAQGQTSYEQAGYGRAGYEQTGYDPAGYGQAGYGQAGRGQAPAYLTAGNADGGQVGPQYSDQGWRIDGTGPIARQRPADIPREIHHPVRPMPAPRAPGQRLGTDTGQLPAYDTGQQPAYDSGQLPAYDTGQLPAYDTGQQRAYDSGQLPAYDTGQQPTHDTGQLPAHDTGQRPAYDSGQLPAYGAEAGSAHDTGQHRAYDDDRHSAYSPAPPGGSGG